MPKGGPCPIVIPWISSRVRYIHLRPAISASFFQPPIIHTLRHLVNDLWILLRDVVFLSFISINVEKHDSIPLVRRWRGVLVAFDGPPTCSRYHLSLANCKVGIPNDQFPRPLDQCAVV